MSNRQSDLVPLAGNGEEVADDFRMSLQLTSDDNDVPVAKPEVRTNQVQLPSDIGDIALRGKGLLQR